MTVLIAYFIGFILDLISGTSYFQFQIELSLSN